MKMEGIFVFGKEDEKDFWCLKVRFNMYEKFNKFNICLLGIWVLYLNLCLFWYVILRFKIRCYRVVCIGS